MVSTSLMWKKYPHTGAVYVYTHNGQTLKLTSPHRIPNQSYKERTMAAWPHLRITKDSKTK